LQYFKGDADEIKMVEAGKAIIDLISLQKSALFEGCYDAMPLGDVLFDSGRTPLSNAIPRNIFRESFNQIFTSFAVAGSFESYLDVFRKIFGDTVDVTFTVPDSGELNIDIIADGLQISNFVARSIVDNAYVFDTIVDDVGDNIVFRTVKGFESQYELEQMLKEMVPAGIYTEITLTVGS
jgi:Ca2+-binding RTX toxin-like protein